MFFLFLFFWAELSRRRFSLRWGGRVLGVRPVRRDVAIGRGQSVRFKLVRLDFCFFVFLRTGSASVVAPLNLLWASPTRRCRAAVAIHAVNTESGIMQLQWA